MKSKDEDIVIVELVDRHDHKYYFFSYDASYITAVTTVFLNQSNGEFISGKRVSVAKVKKDKLGGFYRAKANLDKGRLFDLVVPYEE